MGIAAHDLERGAKVAEVYDADCVPIAQKRLGVITKVNFGGVDAAGNVHINQKATSGDVVSVVVDFGDGKPVEFFGTAQLCLHQKADMAALEKLNEKSQNRVAIDGRAPKMQDALGIGKGPKIAPNDPDMGLRRK